MEGVIKTDQIHCYDVDGRLMDCAGSGQDGEMRFGVKWPNPRFEAREGVVIDRLSGLMWTQDAGMTVFPQTWHEARDFVAQMNREAAFGYQEWHIPERRELFSLISHSRINPALPNEAPFENVFTGYYWTATTCSRLRDQAWYIHLGGGRVYRGMKQGSYMVWPVRNHPNDAASLSAVGHRFICPSKSRSCHAGRYTTDTGAVYDRLTGLGWVKMDAPSADALSWPAALDLIRSINTAGAYGYADWRLPNVRELASLIDVRQHTPALSDGHPFGQVPQGCWSSTTSVYEPHYAWVVYMQDGAVGVGYKKQPDFHVWAVRGGNPSHEKVLSPDKSYAISPEKNGVHPAGNDLQHPQLCGDG
jgi:hypothetical protein